MPCITIEIKHTAEVADGRNIFCTTRELVVNQLRRCDKHIQLGVKTAMEFFQPFGLRHEAFVGQDEEVHVTNPMKVLVFSLLKCLCRAIRAAVEGDEGIVAVAHYLKRELRAVELTLHLLREQGVGDIPNLQLLRGISEFVFVYLIINERFRITERHLAAHHLQVAPCIDEDIIHIALGGGAVAKRIVFQRDANRFAGGVGINPAAHFVSVRILGGARSRLYGIRGFLHMVDRNLKVGRTEIASSHSRLHPTGLSGDHIGETEIEVLGRSEFHLIAEKGSSRSVGIKLIQLMDLIVKELVHNHIG